MTVRNTINVVIVNDFGNINGGTAKIAIDTAMGLSKIDNVSVYYFCATGALDEGIKNSNIKSIHLNQIENIYSKSKIQGLLRGIWNLKARRQMIKLLNELDKESTIVHVHGWTKSFSVSPIQAALSLGFKTVVTLHDFFIYCPNGGFYNFKKDHVCKKTPLSLDCILTNCDSRNYGFKLYRVARSFAQKFLFAIYKKSTDLIVISQLSENIMEKYIREFKSVNLIENPIDVFKIPKIEVKNNKTCLFIGRLASEKGAKYLCEALNTLNYTDAIIIGEGAERAELMKKYPNISFPGWLNKQQIMQVLKKARFLVFPSVWYETYGLVVQEASSMGIPCIVSDCTAAVELVEHNQTGIIFESKNLPQLISEMKMLITEDSKVEFLGTNAYNKFWSEEHSIDSYAQKVEKLYVNILSA